MSLLCSSSGGVVAGQSVWKDLITDFQVTSAQHGDLGRVLVQLLWCWWNCSLPVATLFTELRLAVREFAVCSSVVAVRALPLATKHQTKCSGGWWDVARSAVLRVRILGFYRSSVVFEDARQDVGSGGGFQ